MEAVISMRKVSGPLNGGSEVGVTILLLGYDGQSISHLCSSEDRSVSSKIWQPSLSSSVFVLLPLLRLVVLSSSYDIPSRSLY
jgi:hypothetical protein